MERVTVMLLYVPAGTVVNVPRKEESLCNRVSSTVKEFELDIRLTALPEAGLSAIPEIVTLNEIIEEFAGGVSTAVRLKVVLPPPPPTPPPLCRVQAASAIPARKTASKKASLCFMMQPTYGWKPRCSERMIPVCRV